MKTVLITIAVLIFILYVRTKVCEPFTNSENKSSFQIQDSLVLYYTEWCGYSNMFRPEWDSFVKLAKTNFPNLRVDEVRCEGGNESICNEKGVQGFPTVILYKGKDSNGGQITYDGDRTAEKLTEFVKKYY